MGSIGLPLLQNLWVKLHKHQHLNRSKRQRRMGVEPTRDRAERPPSRFEDGWELLLASSSDRFKPLEKWPEPNSFFFFYLDVATV